MRILFVQALSMDETSSEKVYPLGIVTLATHLQNLDYEIELLDLNIAADPFGSLKNKLLDFKPQAVCISLRNIDPLGNKTSSLVPPFIVAVKMIAKLLPQSWIIAGGTAFSLFPERIMLISPEIDYGIIGEAEESLPKLLSSLANPPAVKGLCLREGEKIKIIPPAQSFAMDKDYLPPSRKLLDPTPYLTVNSYVPAIGIETKRGCPFHCAYCVYPELQGRKLRCRLPVDVVDEIEFLYQEYGISRFHFNDPVVNIPRGHLEEICTEILRRKLAIKWGGFFREDFLTRDNVALFAKSGCECFSFSPDGLCQEALNVLGKNLREEDILKAANLVSKTDIISMYHFMVNVPGENQRTIEKGIRLLDKIYNLHEAKRNLGTIVLNNIRIMPGTPLEAIAKREGVIGPETDLLYPTYYNPEPFNTLRYRLETLHLTKNVFMWQGVK